MHYLKPLPCHAQLFTRNTLGTIQSLPEAVIALGLFRLVGQNALGCQNGYDLQAEQR